MKVIIESHCAMNLLPSITIELCKYDLATLVQNGKLVDTQQFEGKDGIEYYQETKVVVL